MVVDITMINNSTENIIKIFPKRNFFITMAFLSDTRAVIYKVDPQTIRPNVFLFLFLPG